MRTIQAFPIPSIAMEIGHYKENFERAAAFTKLCGFEFPKVKWQEGDLLDEQGDFIERTYELAGVHDRSASAGQCLKWSHYLAPSFEQVLGCTVWPTIGQIWKEDNAVFNPTWKELHRWGHEGIQMDDFGARGGINLHAWMTLPTGEIIEPTFFSTLAVANKNAFGKYLGATTWGRDPGVLPGHRYLPMAIGRRFIESLSSKSIMPMIARNPDELHHIKFGLSIANG